MTISVTHSTPSDGTFSTEGAAAWDASHTVTGFGTMSTQNADSVAITGGTIGGQDVVGFGQAVVLSKLNLMGL